MGYKALYTVTFILEKLFQTYFFRISGVRGPCFIKICSYRNNAWLKLSNILNFIKNKFKYEQKLAEKNPPEHQKSVRKSYGTTKW